MHNFTEKINLLKSLIDKGLLPLINSSCVYLDVPYHTNIGDTLIWEGTEQFLASNHIKCLYRNSTLTYCYKKFQKKRLFYYMVEEILVIYGDRTKN